MLLLFLAVPASAADVLALQISGAINPATDDLVLSAIQEADGKGYQALILYLNTPGGGLEETKAILDHISGSKIPVIGYVYPESATAWSAGTVILLGSDIAAMAPHAIIGSAQPVKLSPTGETEPINDTKTTNAVVALVEEHARAHGRNTTAAREFVLSNLNLNADEAKRLGVIEYISPSPEDLLRQVNGLKVKNSTLDTNASNVINFEPPLSLQFLSLISDPLLAGLLMLIGIYALIFGISNPGLGAEAFGLIALALGLIGLGFDVNLGAVFLILLGVGLLLAELHSHSFGLLAVAGTICIIAGSVLLAPSSYPRWYLPGEYQRSIIVAFLLPSLIIGGFFMFAVYKVAQARLAPPVSGTIVGQEAVALDRLAPRGFVQLQGEYWLAESDQIIEAGERVVVTAKLDSVLKVKRA
jgi:membrane-bound serine protease (ClpP class)